jgi:hypothetical protein
MSFEEEGGRILEGMNQSRVIVFIYRSVTTKSPVKLLYTNKNVF